MKILSNAHIQPQTVRPPSQKQHIPSGHFRRGGLRRGPPDNLSGSKKAWQRSPAPTVDFNASHEEVNGRRDEKRTLSEGKPRSLKEVEGKTLPLLFRNMGQIKEDIPGLRCFVEEYRKAIPLTQDRLMDIAPDPRFFKKILSLLIDQLCLA